MTEEHTGVEQRDDEQNGSQLTYTVEEYTETTRAGGWGKQEITKQRLAASKSYSEMTDREQTLDIRVDTDNVPSEADPGDELTFDDLFDDPRTREEKEQDAIDEAIETGEEVTVKSWTEHCRSSSKECNLDHVTRVATPDGDIENHRTHTY